MMPRASSAEERRGYFGVKVCLFTYLFKHCRLGCCNLLETQKRTSFSLCQTKMNDEAGVEERKLRHQRWPCEYLTVFMGTATDHSQKTHPWLKKKVTMFD